MTAAANLSQLAAANLSQLPRESCIDFARHRDAAWRKWRLELEQTLPPRHNCALGYPEEGDLSPFVTPAIAAVRSWWDAKDGRGVAIIAGPKGVGKSFAMCWAAYYRWPMFFGEDCPKFVRARKLCAMKEDERRDWLDVQHPLVDDLGVETGGDAWRAFVDELVDVWYQEERTVIVTTNLSAAQIEDRYGERVADRFAECAKWIPVVGESMRRGTP